MSKIVIKTPANAMSEVSNYGLAWLATTIPLLLVSVILISSRVVWKDEDLKKTDVGVLIALGFAIAQEIAVCVGILISGLGYDVAFLGLEMAQKATTCLYISQIFYQTTIATNKITLIFFYLDFLSGSKFRIMHHITAISILLSLVAFDTTTIFQCTPISYFWDRAIERGYCINTSALSIAHASTNIFFNLLLFILSIPTIRSLHLSTSQKHASTCAYFLGCLILTTSILNLSYLIPQSPQNPPDNQTQQPVLLFFTRSLEPILGLLLLTLLTLHAPISHLFTSLTHPLPSIPHARIPFLPKTTITTKTIRNLFTRPRTPHPTPTQTQTRTTWKPLKNLPSTSSFRSSRSHPTNLDTNKSIDDETMVYVTILGDLHAASPMKNTTVERYV